MPKVSKICLRPPPGMMVDLQDDLQVLKALIPRGKLTWKVLITRNKLTWKALMPERMLTRKVLTASVECWRCQPGGH